MTLRKSAAYRVGPAFLVLFACSAWQSVAHADLECGAASPDASGAGNVSGVGAASGIGNGGGGGAGYESPFSNTITISNGMGVSYTLSESTILRGGDRGTAPSFRSSWLNARAIEVIETQREQLLASLPTAADADGAGQSLTGESLTNPASCHGVVVDSGNMVHVETDFSGSGEMPLTLTRAYNKAVGFGIFGKRWSSSFDYYLSYSATSRMCEIPEESEGEFEMPESCTTPGSLQVYLYRPGGVQLGLAPTGQAGVFANGRFTARELKDAQGVRTGWEVHTDDDGVETYGTDSLPVKVLNKHGVGWAYYYTGTPKK